MYKRSGNITKIKKSEKTEVQDIVLIESPIDLYVNSKLLVNIICLPKDLKELVVGFLFSIGMINIIEDIKNIKIDELDNKILIELNDSIDFKAINLELNPLSRVVDTTWGISSPWRNIIKKSLNNAKESLKPLDDLKLSSKVIFSSIIEMQKRTNLFRETGGCHGAAIFDINGKILSVKEIEIKKGFLFFSDKTKNII